MKQNLITNDLQLETNDNTWCIDIKIQSGKLELLKLPDKIKQFVSIKEIDYHKITRDLIKVIVKLLKYKIRLRKNHFFDEENILAGVHIINTINTKGRQNLFEAIVEIVAFHEVLGEFFVFKTVNAQLYFEDTDTFDIDSLFDDPIYLPDHTVFPNIQKTSVKILTEGEELLGLYAYILNSICEFFELNIPISSNIKHHASNFYYEYGLPQNLFLSENLDEILTILQDILIKIDKISYIKDPDYYRLYNLLYDFVNLKSEGFSLPFYDLWEYLCLNHYLLQLEQNQNQKILCFDLEDNFYIFTKHPTDEIFKVTFEKETFKGPITSKHLLRPDLVIVEYKNNEIEKITIIDMKFKEDVSTEDLVKMDLYLIGIGNDDLLKTKPVECKFVLPKKNNGNKKNNINGKIEYKDFFDLLKEFISTDGIDRLISVIESGEFKEVKTERSSQTDYLKYFIDILILLKEEKAYKIVDYSKLKVLSSSLKNKNDKLYILNCCLSLFSAEGIKINGKSILGFST